MKVLICFLYFLVPTVHAVTLTQYQSSPEGNSLQSVSFSKSTTLTRRSNTFDRTLKLRLGIFTLGAGESVAQEERAIGIILTKIRTVEENLLRRGSSFNQLSPAVPHGSYFLVDDFRVSDGSNIYPELLKIFNNLLLKKWRHQEGIRVSDDLKFLTSIKGGRDVSTETFNYSFHCNRERPPGYCLFKGQGILFVD